MTKQLFAKLAVKNIRSNKQIYIPYIVSSVATVAMFYLMYSLVENDYLKQRSESLVQLFTLGSVIIGIFSFIFILYTNSFLIKRRKKEIGLYAILGMKKKHVAFVLMIESLITSLGSILVGIISGQIIGRFVFLGLNYVLDFPVSMEYPFSLTAIVITFVGFTAVFSIALLYNISQVTFSNPIELVKGKQSGEKEPKSSILLFILSLVALGAGYGISLSIKDPLSAIIYFFLAVLLVIIGTYLLFISGSIFILKAMKKNKKIYYKPNAFISISGMLYRMKQNAAGLANICILATMVIITISTTAAIFIGSEQAMDRQFPFENHLTVFEAEPKDLTDLQEIITTETESRGLAVKNFQAYRSQSLTGTLEENEFVMKSTLEGNIVITEMVLVPKEDFEQLAGTTIPLEKDEVAVFNTEADYTEPTLKMAVRNYQVKQFEGKETVEKVEAKVDDLIGESLFETTLVLMNEEDFQSLINMYKELYPDLYFDSFSAVDWNTNGTSEEKRVYAEEMTDVLYDSDYSVGYRAREIEKDAWYQMNGGLLFIGIFLGFLFTFGAALITYFKQVSEGYDDRSKFQIMQKVGLDEKMIQKSTRSQILWMFFLPLGVAVMHTAFAFPIVQKLLMIFGVADTGLIIQSILGVVISFSLLYWIIYRITSKVYFSIVK